MVRSRDSTTSRGRWGVREAAAGSAPARVPAVVQPRCRPPRTHSPASQREAANGLTRSLSHLFDGSAAASQYASKIAYRREYLVVPVGALRIISSLLVFHDFLVLAEDILGKPAHERPNRVNDSRHV